jgi:hypothetical protein
MRTFQKLMVASSIVAALLVSGCGATGSSEGIQPVNLTDSAKVAELCGEKAVDVANIVASAANAKEGSGKRNKLSDWGLDPTNTEQINATKAALDKQTKVACGAPAPAPSASPSPTGAAPKHTEGTTTVADKNGKREAVTSLSGGEIPNGDTTNNPQMPPLAGDLLLNCGMLQGWDTLVPCIENSKQGGKWYIDKVNSMHAEGKIQFSWPDVQKWAKAKTKSGNLPEARVITVFGYTQAEMPADKARANVANIVGGQDVANGLEVVYHQSPYLDTLRPLYKDQEQTPSIKEFANYIEQVRVSVVPLVLDVDGFVTGKVKDAWSGVFVDCWNIWGKWAFMPAKPTEEIVCPPGTDLEGKPVPMDGLCSPPKVDQPPTSVPPAGPPVVPPVVIEAKIPSQGSYPQGNAPVGGGRNDTSGTGTYIPPQEMQQPPAVQPAPPAAPAPQPAPVGNEPAPNPNPAPFTPAPQEPGVNPAPAPGTTEPPRNSGDPGNPFG